MNKMCHNIFFRLFSSLLLILFFSENFDFFILMGTEARRTPLPSSHEKCYCSECYDSHAGCLCWLNPGAEEAPNTLGAAPYYRACNCPVPESAYPLFPSRLNECLLFLSLTLTPRFPQESVWPADKMLFLTDLFVPSIDHPPES